MEVITNITLFLQLILVTFFCYKKETLFLKLSVYQTLKIAITNIYIYQVVDGGGGGGSECVGGLKENFAIN
jgi:hypothetical protein